MKDKQESDLLSILTIQSMSHLETTNQYSKWKLTFMPNQYVYFKTADDYVISMLVSEMLSTKTDTKKIYILFDDNIFIKEIISFKDIDEAEFFISQTMERIDSDNSK